ncbi:hypothetical protein CDL15_Pgr027736 [Punica granatum]|uniref:Uncharacterized protein n=1 Tax=Punica granatum TaxID=22663 RepID=A0A218XJT3_PUNGR|nr:hypothetical protein CDL15_Pgr027736 [Punica granatum]
MVGFATLCEPSHGVPGPWVAREFGGGLNFLTFPGQICANKVRYGHDVASSDFFSSRGIGRGRLACRKRMFDGSGDGGGGMIGEVVAHGLILESMTNR